MPVALAAISTETLWVTPNQNPPAKPLLNFWSQKLWDNGCLLFFFKPKVLRSLLYSNKFKKYRFGTQKWGSDISNALKYWNSFATELWANVGSTLGKIVKGRYFTLNLGTQSGWVQKFWEGLQVCNFFFFLIYFGCLTYFSLVFFIA